MDKTTKTFVIAACSVVIAAPVAIFGLIAFTQFNSFLKTERASKRTECENQYQLEVKRINELKLPVPSWSDSKRKPLTDEQARTKVEKAQSAYSKCIKEIR